MFVAFVIAALSALQVQKYRQEGYQELRGREQSVKDLKESEEHFRTLAEESPNMIFINQGGRIVYANKKSTDIVGYSREEFYSPSFNFLTLTPPEYIEKVKLAWAKHLNGEDIPPYEYALVTREGKTIVAIISTRLIDYKGKKAILGIVTDISERKKAEEELKESEERLKRSEEIAHLGSWELDLKQDKLTWSDEVYRIFGLKPQEFGASYEAFLAYVHPDDRVAVDEAYMSSVHEGKDGYEIEHRVVRKDNGEVRVVYEKCNHVRDENGNVVKSLGMVHDVTERNMAEAKLEEYKDNLEKLVEERTKQLKDAERLAAIGATAGMVGHDIRNPLQAIVSDIYLLNSTVSSVSDSEARKEGDESLDSIRKNVDYINKIVQDLQDFAKSIVPALKEINLQDICNHTLNEVSIPENIAAFCKVDDSVKAIISDSDLIKRILTNLVSNAIHAMPKGGKLQVSAYKEGFDTVIAVEDTGVGIPEENKAKLFTPLFTTRSKGQGFGLAVIKRMTEALGGTVTFESEVGKGTTFIVRLPPKS